MNIQTKHGEVEVRFVGSVNGDTLLLVWPRATLEAIKADNAPYDTGKITAMSYVSDISQMVVRRDSTIGREVDSALGA